MRLIEIEIVHRAVTGLHRPQRQRYRTCGRRSRTREVRYQTSNQKTNNHQMFSVRSSLPGNKL
jgi:hypothetical protein